MRGTHKQEDLVRWINLIEDRLDQGLSVEWNDCGKFTMVWQDEWDFLVAAIKKRTKPKPKVDPGAHVQEPSHYGFYA